VIELYKRSLAIDVKHEGPDGINTSIGNKNLGHFHRKLAGTCLSAGEIKEHLHLSISYYTEALRINTKIFGPDNHESIEAALDLSESNCLLSEA
jgi:hypothetical protein